MTIALVDADTPVFAAAVSSDDQHVHIALSRLDVSINKIIEQSGCGEFRLYVSGGDNFRKELDPRYKANRPKVDPIHREACKQHLIKHWDAIETDGYEADDAVGCEQTKDTMIVGIDKDLLMIPGKHFQWPLVRQGKVLREGVFHTTSYIDGLRLFYTQALVGDKSDNILQWFDKSSDTWKKNKWALGQKKAEKLLEDVNIEEDMYNVVKNHYIASNKLDELATVLDLLWIWRSYGETYSIRRMLYG